MTRHIPPSELRPIDVRHKDMRRARLFELARQSGQAEAYIARIRRMAWRKSSPEDFETLKSTAMQSLQASPKGPAGGQLI